MATIAATGRMEVLQTWGQTNRSHQKAYNWRTDAIHCPSTSTERRTHGYKRPTVRSNERSSGIERKLFQTMARSRYVVGKEAHGTIIWTRQLDIPQRTAEEEHPASLQSSPYLAQLLNGAKETGKVEGVGLRPDSWGGNMVRVLDIRKDSSG